VRALREFESHSFRQKHQNPPLWRVFCFCDL
jgi:hypothetical protein